MFLARRGLVAFVALLVAGVSCFHTRYKPIGRPVPYEGFFATFPSGMRLIAYEMPHVDRFMLAVSYRAGAVDDPQGQEGLAHLVEHLSFRARTAARGLSIWDRLLASGVGFNAFTSHDETVYWLIGKPADAGLALEIEAGRMRDPLAGVGEDDFRVDRDVVLSEYRERFETDPEGAERQWLLEAAFPRHPYGRPVGGDPASLGRITLADVRRWIGERYAPASAVLVLVSPLPARQATDLVARTFGTLVGGPARRLEPVKYQPPGMPTPAESPRVIVRRAPVAQPHLWVAWPVPGYYSKRIPHGYAAALDLESVIAGRIARIKWEEVVDSLSVGFLPLDGAGLIYARIALRKESDAENALDVVRLAAGSIRVGEVRRQMTVEYVRDRLLAEGYLALEDIDVTTVARFLRATGFPDYLRGWQILVAMQMRYDIDEYADEWLQGSRAVSVLVVPDKNALARDVTRASPRRHRDEFDPLEDDLLGVPPPSAEQVLAALNSPGLDRAERRVLANGLQVAVAKRGTLPVAQVRLAVRTRVEGSPEVPAGLPQLAFAATSSLFTFEKNRVTGAASFHRLRPESLVLGERGSSGNLDVLLEATASWVRNLHVGGFAELRKWRRHQLELDEARPGVIAERSLRERLFPGHPYGAAPDSRSLEEMKWSDGQAWLDRQVRPEKATLLVVSDEPPNPELWNWIDGEFGGWSSGKGTESLTAEPALPEKRSLLLIDRPGASQAVFVVGLRAPPLSARDAPAFEAVSWLLRSYLNRRLRVEEGVSYGVSVDALERERGAALLVGASVDREAAGRCLRYTTDTISALAARPLQPASASRARWQVARAFAFRFDTVGETATALERMALHRLPPDYYEKLPSSIASLDAGRIQAAVKELSVGREVIVIQGDGGVLLPQLKEAGFAVEVASGPAAGERK